MRTPNLAFISNTTLRSALLTSALACTTAMPALATPSPGLSEPHSFAVCHRLTAPQARHRCVAALVEHCLKAQNKAAIVQCFDAANSGGNAHRAVAKVPSDAASSESPAQAQAQAFGKNRDTSKDIKSISSQIDNISTMGDKTRVFLLKNNQLWRESSPDKLKLKKGDFITIKRSVLGSYSLKKDGIRRFTKVVRIQ